MKRGFYPRLAWTGIRKNRKTYLPYMLTCVGMVAVFYLIAFLSSNPNIALVRGGASLQTILGLGTGVIGIFSLIFLFYTNSFLIRRRKKEFGLYNILGMGKKSLARILLWESWIISAVALVGGLAVGILFSKLSELMLLNLMRGDINLTFWIEPEAIVAALLLFAGIFALIFLNTLRQIHVSNPIALLQSEAAGEKPPKGNRLIAVLGVIVLGVAYYISVTIQEPLLALLWFFVAVVMVIVASYMLFISGSVALCKALQKNTRYYYKTNHFVSLSSMAYRMKRNGAGLASICILSTMVLVMVSSTVCLFIGTEDALQNRYPRDFAIETYSVDRGYMDRMRAETEDVLRENKVTAENVLQYRYLVISGFFTEDQVSFDESRFNSQSDIGRYMRTMYVVELDDYNRLAGTHETLADDEVLVAPGEAGYGYDTLTLNGSETVQVKKTVARFVDTADNSVQIVPSFFIVATDFDRFGSIFQEALREYDTTAERNYCGFNLTLDEDAQIALTESLTQSLREVQRADQDFPAVSIANIAADRADFYGLNGGLFFLGILLGFAFVSATVLIMTKREIKKSINSQVLTTFFLPLLAAGLHLTFAFPIISKLLMLFGLVDTGLLIAITVGCYLIFALFYILVYRITSHAYYDIVSDKRLGEAA